MRDTSTQALLNTLGELADFCRQRGNDENALRVEELADKLRSQTFNLVVFGEFKRGKTTLLNAPIGQELLPSAVVPLTSVVTVLHYGPVPEATVEFEDGHEEIVAPERLGEFVTEKGNPNNVRQVKIVRVAVPSPLLRNGLQLVDTPGVGSVYDHNTEVAREFLPQVDGAILLVASDPPISRGECEFLMEMRPHVARLFVVQNKIDQLRPSEASESVEFTRNVLCQVLGHDDIAVFALSAREGLEAQLTHDAARLAASGLPAFMEELRRFQEKEQAQTLVLSVVCDALEVAEDEDLGLGLERQAMSMSLEQIEQRSAEFRRRRDELMTQRRDDVTLIRDAAHRVIGQTLQQDYERERRERAPELHERFGRWAVQQQQIAVHELLTRGNQFVRETLFEILGVWRREEQQRIEAALRESLDRFTVRANETLGAIFALAREVFELPPRSVETVGYLSAPSRFLWQDWRWEARSSVAASPLWRWLPGARARVLRALEKKLLDEHDYACGRLRHDFAERARAAFDEYIRSVDRSLSEALAGIDRAIDRAIAQKQQAVEAVEETVSRVAEQGDRLGRLVTELRAALPAGEALCAQR